MLHIVVRSENARETLLEAHGWITGANVPLLEAELRRREGKGRRLVLDMAQVRLIDRDGADLLRPWVAAGLILRRGSTFVRQLLREYGLETDRSQGDTMPQEE